MKNVPAAQAMQYTIERALETLTWLEETEKERRKKYDAKEDGSKTCLRARILTDIVSVYVAALVEKNGSGHSLLKSYAPKEFTKKFAALPIVKKCEMNRHNRSGHESKSYGHFVSTEDILNSDLKSRLKEATYFLVTTPEKGETLKK